MPTAEILHGGGAAAFSMFRIGHVLACHAADHY